jgi:hypothetical protein
LRQFLTTFALALALPAGACVPGAPPPAGPLPGEPAADPAAVAAALRASTLPEGPRHATFGWELDEAGARFRGRGVARFEAPERFRLDLFGPRGESYLAGALVGDEARVPAAVEERFALPSPALLWATVGVVRPPGDARLAEASERGGAVALRYLLPGGDVLEYRARDGRLESLRRLRGRGVAESVELAHDQRGVARAVYRDWPAYRSLTLTVESLTDAAPFDEAIWSPPGT